MGPGPSDVHPRILEALSRPTIGHLDPAFVAMMDQLKDMLRDAFQTDYHSGLGAWLGRYGNLLRQPGSSRR
jgi:aspartate aminotransferase-like enzyme